MNPKTATSLHGIKKAVLDRHVVALRDCTSRIDALKSEREALATAIDNADPGGSISAALAGERHRRLLRQQLALIDEDIAAVVQNCDRAGEAVAEAFAETRALERLMRGGGDPR